MSKRTASPGLGSLGSGAVTAVGLAVQTGLSAVVGIIVAREFGRTEETDGFFAAYGVFVVVVLAAVAIRVTVLPPLARARVERRLGGETASYALALGMVVVPLIVIGIAARDQIAWLLTGAGPEAAQETATAALPWMMFAAGCQVFAGLGASALAALDSYAVAAGGYVVASLAGFALILARIEPDGIQAVAWGMALNGAIALIVPAVALAARARAESVPRSAARPHGPGIGARLVELGRGVSLPLAMQAVYVVCLSFAAQEGVGAPTSFGYAYLLASALVATTASALGLVTSVPLTRLGLDPGGVTRHVVASSWLALAAVAAAAGLFATAGEPILHAVLGDAYGSEVGTELGRVFVALAPWAAMAVGYSVTFPLVFVAGRGRRLPWLALGVFGLHLPIAWALGALAGLEGLALALAVSTGIALGVMLYGMGALPATSRGILLAALVVAGLALLGFAVPAVVLEPAAAGAVGLTAYVVLLAVLHPPGLRSSWRYLRALA